MTQDSWLSTHPYLQSVADLHAQIEKAAFNLPRACIPSWHDYEHDYRSGVPLLRSPSSTVDLKPFGIILWSLINKLSSMPLPYSLTQEIRDLQARDPLALQHAAATLLNADGASGSHAGLMRYLGWTAMARYLLKVVHAFGQWRDEEHWLRQYCPTCGSLPAMAQLVGIDPGRVRLLSCGCCGTRWRYQRTACPFCENRDDHRLAALVIDGEEDLRIDYCESCSGYIKTYNGSGSESVMLADWTSLHLDIIACDRGLKRFSASLYEM